MTFITDQTPKIDDTGPKPRKKSLFKKSHGEQWVWVTSLGLALGLMMIFALIGVVLVNGLTVFWPKKVIQYEVKTDSRARIGESVVLAGEITKKQSRKANGEHHREWQLFVGNRDLYGLSFRFVDEADILTKTYPEDLLLIERMEYGDAIVYPLEIRLDSGEVIEYTDKEFMNRLDELSDEVTKRRKNIIKIEKKEIGSINAKMERLRLKKKASNDGSEKASIENEMNLLQADYEVLATKAKTLRRQQKSSFLIYQSPTGQTKELPVGHIVKYYFPNRLSFGERIGWFYHNIWDFLTSEPREANTEGGIFPAIFGTFVMTVFMSFSVTPFGVIAAIYLREYAKQGVLVRSVRIAVNNLAGVPSIVFGVFGLGFFVYLVGGTIDELFFKTALPTPTFGTGGLMWASLTLALMTVPVVIVSTEEALAAVPRGAREGSLACGASKWQTIQRVVLPAAAPGIMTGFILAMARGAGEVAPLMLVGVVKLAPTLPIDHLMPFIHFERKFMHLGFHIYDLGFQSPDSEAAKPMVFATTLVLLALVLILNLSAILIRQRLRRKYALGAV